MSVIVPAARAASQVGSSAFTTIDVSGAGTGQFQGTGILGINSAEDVTGTYLDANGVIHGFVLPAGGTMTTFDATGAGTAAGEGTVPRSINSSGTITGVYFDSNKVCHGFVRAANGAISTFDAPGAGIAPNRGTSAMSINDSGVIVGFFSTGSGLTNTTYHGFLRAANGTIINIDAPDAGSSEGVNSSKEGTSAYGITNAGVIVGSYKDSNAVQHGFVRSTSGTFTEFDPPGVGTCIAAHGQNFGGTSALGIDAAGDVTGYFLDTSCHEHGFLRTASGSFTILNAPGAAAAACSNTGPGEMFCGTSAIAIDNAGNIVGGYVDTNGIVHGFLRATDTGTITSFDDPNAGSSSSMEGTGAFTVSLNSTATGINIAGTYADTNSVLHGFIYTPALTATTTTLSPAPAPSPSVFGEPVTLYATVSSGSGAPPNGENVTFMSGATTLGTAPLGSGSATLTTTALPVGSDSITAVYGGDSDFSGSTSTAVGQTVGQASSSATLTSNLNPSNFAQSATFTAIVTGQFGGAATGSVTFSSGSMILGTVSLSANSASLATTALPVGTDTVTAVYSGDSSFSGSVSNTVSQVVGAPLSVPGDWTWMGGSSIIPNNSGNSGQPGTYGKMGTPASGNIPGGREGASSWTDGGGHLWLFGGGGFDANGNNGLLNDLWIFNPSTNEWTWEGGSNTRNQPGVYGTLGAPAAENIPGGREDASTWTDRNGNIWLFGGLGCDAKGIVGDLNDLWKLDPSTSEWTWEGGSKTVDNMAGQAGVYGTLGTPDAGNIPGGRWTALSWTDSSGHLWLFGGFISYASGGNTFTSGTLNDLWEFDPSTNEWTWVGGSSTRNQPGVYGALGTPAAGNVPGGRWDATSWTDSSGYFWLFGGIGYDGSGILGGLNDLWQYNPSTNDWAWMGGSSTVTQPGVYGALGMPAVGNIPGARGGSMSWADSSGRSWLFGGEGNDGSGKIGSLGFLNDLWEFDPSTNEWAWMGGSSTFGNNCELFYGSTTLCGQPGVYGLLGTPAVGNVPGARFGQVNWTDSSGNLWLFGGGGYDADGAWGYLNDLWKYWPPLTTATTTTLHSSSNTSNYGASVTLTATVSSSSGAPPDGESVTFLSGTTTLGTAQLSSGTATLTTTALPVGTDAITAVYGGDANFSGSASNTVSQVVLQSPNITVSPVSQTVAVGSTATFSVTATGTPTLSYAWQYLSGSTWKPFAAGTGLTSASMTTFATTAAYNGLQFRVVVTDGNNLSTASNPVTLTVAPAITAQPASQIVAVGSTATFSVTAGGVSALTYQWQYLSVGGSTWKTFAAGTGLTTATMTTFATTPAYNGLQFRVVVTGGNGLTTTSNTATLTVAPAITIQPANQTLSAGSTATFSVAAAGVAPLTYVWQYLAVGGSTWKPFAAGTGTTTASLTTFNTTPAYSGLKFRVVVTDGNGLTATSNTATLTVAPAISAQPTNQTVAAGSTATFSVTASGVGTLTYAWQYLSVGGSTWKPFAAGTGLTTATMATFATTPAYNGLQLRVVVTDGNGFTATSNAATLTVAPAITIQPVSQSVSAGSPATFSVTATGVPTLTYVWKYLSVGGSTWKTFAAGTGLTTATMTTFATTPAYNGLQFRVVVTDGNSLTATSNTATLTVH